jgi:hypothetical protein
MFSFATVIVFPYIPIRVHNSIDPVSNGNNGALLELLSNGFLYDGISFHIDLYQGFV